MSPNRSSSCGRSSPSSGFIVPTSRNARRADRDPVALDVRAAHRGGVEQQVDEVVVEQVDLVDVEHAAVRVGEQAGLVGLDALGERPLEVQRADEAVLGGPDRQLDQPRGRRGVAAAAATRAARAAPSGHAGSGGVAGSQENRQPGDDRDGRQQRGQRPHGRRLRGALLPAHQHPADAGVNGVEQQREPQVVVADDGGEREPDDGSPSGATRGTEEVTAGSLPTGGHRGRFGGAP